MTSRRDDSLRAEAGIFAAEIFEAEGNQTKTIEAPDTVTRRRK